MSDSQQHANAQDPAQGAPEQAGPSAGTLLREAREAAGLHIAALAVSLKVPVRKLEALEADRLDLLPDAVFVRALASSVCRTLKMDPAPVLERLPQTAAPRLVRESGGINTPFRAPSDGRNPSWLDQLSKPVFLAVFALLLGALVLIFLPSARQDEAAGPGKPEVTSAAVAANPAAPAEAASAMAVVAAPVPAPTPAPATPPVPPPSAQPTVVISPGGTVPPAKAVSPTFSVAVSTPAVISPTAVVTPAVPLPSTGVVVFKAQGESWVEVTDAKGVIAVRKTLAPGEVVGASGALPLAVVIGRANATRVEVRGRPFDLNAVAKDNVARFEVK
jgi:cytoskeleton protein RodZ